MNTSRLNYIAELFDGADVWRKLWVSPNFEMAYPLRILGGLAFLILLLLCYIVAQGDFIMAANSVVRARIDEQTKNEAAAVLKAMGLTVSDAFRLMMVKIAEEKALPFEPLVPNQETIEAMKAARRGELTTVGPPGKPLPSLNADC